jgi:hypothetical protein
MLRLAASFGFRAGPSGDPDLLHLELPLARA